MSEQIQQEQERDYQRAIADIRAVVDKIGHGETSIDDEMKIREALSFIGLEL